MSGWHSLQSVGTLHVVLQIAGVLIAAVVIAAGTTSYHFWNRWSDLVAIAGRARDRYLPRWRTDPAVVLHNGLIEIAILGIAALLALGYATSQYGQRKDELKAAAHAATIAKARNEADALRRALNERSARAANVAALRHALTEAEVRRLAETASLRREIEQIQARRAGVIVDREAEARLAAELDALRRASEQAAARHAVEITALKQSLQQNEIRRLTVVESLRWEVRQSEVKAKTEISRLQDQLTRAERRLASLQMRRRLSDDEKNALIDALQPYAGQRVAIAAIAGDEDGRIYAQDFVEVFDAAGWKHAAVSYRTWDRDPVGVEVTLNEADGRAGRVNTGVGALINIVRRLSLTAGNTIYMTEEVPSGEVQVKIGKKLPR
jgi:hypothetical protein